jgi:hypothetical protein
MISMAVISAGCQRHHSHYISWGHITKVLPRILPIRLSFPVHSATLYRHLNRGVGLAGWYMQACKLIDPSLLLRALVQLIVASITAFFCFSKL